MWFDGYAVSVRERGYAAAGILGGFEAALSASHFVVVLNSL